MNKLVEEIIKPILEANSDIKKVVGIFGGRFQPFGSHHKKVYEWLSKQFDDAYITTSNIKKLPRHPMNYKEKVRHMTKIGIPKSKIVQEKSPFVAKNLAKKFRFLRVLCVLDVLGSRFFKKKIFTLHRDASTKSPPLVSRVQSTVDEIVRALLRLSG